MSQNRREMQVGLAVILSALVLVAGTLWFKNFRFAGGVVRYAADFSAVEGLQVRDRVQVRGIRMGAVDDFTVIDDRVRVNFHIDRGMPLHDDARIQLATMGIVGEMVVEIDPGSGAPVPEGHVFQGQVAVSLTAITESIRDALIDLRALSSEVQGLVADIRAEDRIPATLDAAGSAATNLDELVRENRESMHNLVSNFEATSAALRTALAGPDSNLARSTDAVVRSLTRADSVLTRIDHTSVLLHEVVERLETGEGTLGQLLTDETLYLRTDSTLTSLSRLLNDLRRNPKKYFKFNVIDF